MKNKLKEAQTQAIQNITNVKVEPSKNDKVFFKWKGHKVN